MPKIFDCVVVITDRQVLDQQLQDAIYQIEHAQGVVKAIDQDSKQLAAALIDGTKIVITTLQKFPFVLRGLLHAAGAESQEKRPPSRKRQASAVGGGNRQAAVCRHRGRGALQPDRRDGAGTEGDSRRGGQRRESRGGSRIGKTGLNQVMQSRGRQPNLSFFAFTATPKGKTLELFGRTGASGLPEAFHLYSMRQAIEEGFILDVLKNYTTYATYYRLGKGHRGRSEPAQEEGGAGAGQVHEPAPAQHRAEDRGDGGALPAEGARASRRAGQGDGRHLLAPACGALHAGLRALHRGERHTPTCARWSPSAAR